MAEPCTVWDAMRLIRRMLILRCPRTGSVVEHPVDGGRIRFFVDPLLPDVLTVEPRETEIHIEYLDLSETVHAYLPLDRAEIVHRLTPVITAVLEDAGCARGEDDDD